MTAKLHKTSPVSQTDAPPRRQAMKQGDSQKIDALASKALLVSRPRIRPTPEDQAIFKRNFARILRWSDEHQTPNAMKVFHRWTGDYLHH